MKSGYPLGTTIACTIALWSGIANAGEIAFSLIDAQGRVDVSAISHPAVHAVINPFGADGHVVEIVVAPRIAEAICSLSRRSVDKELAVVVGCDVVSRPVVREPLCVGRFWISGRDTREEAENLARRIRSGSRRCEQPIS